MGTEVDHYVMIGVDVIDADFVTDEWRDKHEDLADFRRSEGALTLIFDGMSGEYCVVGRVIAVSRGDQFEGFEMLAFVADDLTKQFAEVGIEIRERFPEITETPKLRIFSHYH